jgi:hypothetical protein
VASDVRVALLAQELVADDPAELKAAYPGPEIFAANEPPHRGPRA